MTLFLRESWIVFNRQPADEPAQPGVGHHRDAAAGALPAAVRPAAQAGDLPGSAATSTPGSCPACSSRLGIFGAFFAGFSLIGEWREGVIEAERVTPAHRSALLFGRLYRDLLQSVRAGGDPRGPGAGAGDGCLLRRHRGRRRPDHAARRGVRRGVERAGADDQERGRDGADHQRRDDAGAAAQRDPAADELRRRLAGAAQRLHADPARGRRGPRVLLRRLRQTRCCGAWAGPSRSSASRSGGAPRCSRRRTPRSRA
nr:hypothetical protein [Nocardioides convexus]